MQLDIRGRRVHVTPREAAWDLYGPRLDPDWRKLEIKSWVQLHHLKLMTSCGRSLARSIARSKATGTSQA